MIWNNREIILLLIIIENKKKNQREREKIKLIYLAFLAAVVLVVLLADAGALPFFVCLAAVGSLIRKKTHISKKKTMNSKINEPSSGVFSTTSFVRSSNGSSV